jgi:hypothetical protein
VIARRSCTAPWRASALALLAFATSGCDEIDLPKSWAVAYPRVLALRSEVVGDETRATPEPGESLRVRVLIAAREPIERLSYRLFACPGVRVSGELPACSAEPFAELDGVLGQDGEGAPFADELALELQLPDGDALEGVEQILIAGNACVDGDPRDPADPRADECRGSAETAMTWVANVTLARAERDYNQNPELPEDAIALDGDVWPTAVPPDDPADEDGTVSVVADGEPHEIAVSLDDSNRERFEGEPEALLLSHFTTAGPLQRRFNALEASDPGDEPLTVEWRSPRPPEGVKPPTSARLFFVLRDQRGGVAFTTRRAAIEPAPEPQTD